MYLTFVGVETDRFNKQIYNKIDSLNKDIRIDLKSIKLVLDPLNLNFNVKTLGPKIISKNKEIELESIKTQISLYSIFKNNFSPTKIEISTKSLEIKKLISFIRSLNRSPKLLVLEAFIKKGFVIADVKLEFDENGNFKKNYNINGFVKDGKIKLFEKNTLEKIDFIFNLENNKTLVEDLRFNYNELDLEIDRLILETKNSEILINGDINNDNLIIDGDIIKKFFQNKNFDIKKIDLSSNNKFSFKLDKKFKFNDFNLKSKIKLNKASIINNLNLKDILPDIKEQIELSKHELEVNYYKDEFQIKGKGNILAQNSLDFLNYSFNKKNGILNFYTSLEIKDNPFFINFLNFKKKENSDTNISVKGSKEKNNETKINYFHIKDKKNQILFNGLLLDNNNKLIKLDNAELKYLDIENQKNDLKIVNNKKNYILSGTTFNVNKLIDDLINSEDESHLNIFKNSFNLKVNIDKVRLDKNYFINNLNGKISLFNNEVTNADLVGFFSKDQKVKLTVIMNNEEKITTFYSDHASPFIQRYKFIKGFNEGSLDFNSSKVGNKTNSNLKIYNFKVKKVPVLTKLLSLASLQGIADLLSGEGIRFNEFDMKFNNLDSLMTIEEVYGIGPAISILMDGYIEKNKLVSLRGTLVPATTINKVISSIPLVGQILVGSKTGEGVFGVSFKIKGPPKKLETSVNPIKTLTPRFITRTLEKLKKN